MKREEGREKSPRKIRCGGVGAATTFEADALSGDPYRYSGQTRCSLDDQSTGLHNTKEVGKGEQGKGTRKRHRREWTGPPNARKTKKSKRARDFPS